MHTDKYGQTIVNVNDVFTALYNGTLKDLADVQFDNKEEVDQFNRAVSANADHISKLALYQEPGDIDSLELFDEANQLSWFMPKEYSKFPMVEWLLDQTQNEEQYQRVVTELELYIQHDMMELLNYIKYLVDFMREHKIVWGVGRGSSVASYVLYLIGVHKVDSIKYDLDIHEFLK
jgi:DNA polymerase III alpha subunit